MLLPHPLLLGLAASLDDLKCYPLTGRVLRGHGLVQKGLIDLVKAGLDGAAASALNVSSGQEFMHQVFDVSLQSALPLIQPLCRLKPPELLL